MAKSTNSALSGDITADNLDASNVAGGNDGAVSGGRTAAASTGETGKARSADTGAKANETGGEGYNAKAPLSKFFLDSIKDIYSAEKALTEALPKMQEAATTEELREAFEDHTLQTRKHVSRLEKVFKMLGEKAEAKKCDAMAGLIKEGEHVIESTPEGSMTRDAALIIAAQKVEHYEIASYGGLVQLAITLGEDDVADVLDMTLAEEEDTDLNLTDIAEEFINFEAEEETEDDIMG